MAIFGVQFALILIALTSALSGCLVLLLLAAVFVQLRASTTQSAGQIKLEPSWAAVWESISGVRPIAGALAVAPSRAPPTFLRRFSVDPGIRAAE